MKLTKLETAEEQLELAQRCYEMGYRVADMAMRDGQIVNRETLERDRDFRRELLKHLVDLTEEETEAHARELYEANFTEGYAHWLRMQTAAITYFDPEGDQMCVFLDPLSQTFAYQLNLSEGYGTYPDELVTGFDTAEEAERAARERYEKEFKHRHEETI